MRRNSCEFRYETRSIWVQCGELMRHLMEKGLVCIVDRDDSLGRSMLYGTTKKFLQMFGLNSLKDLPEIEQLRPPAATGAQA